MKTSLQEQQKSLNVIMKVVDEALNETRNKQVDPKIFESLKEALNGLSVKFDGLNSSIVKLNEAKGQVEIIKSLEELKDLTVKQIESLDRERRKREEREQKLLKKINDEIGE